MVLGNTEGAPDFSGGAEEVTAEAVDTARE